MDPAPEASERGDTARAGARPDGPAPPERDAALLSRAGVVVPLRSFRGGKSRLAPRLDADGRAALARTLADRVADVAAPHRTVVVSSDPDVVAWARHRRLAVIADPGSLDGAARAGSEHLAALGLERVVVAHADLALVTTLADLVAPGADRTAVVVPCRRHDGTPLLSLPAAVAVTFPFAYGPGSFARHVAHAQQHGLTIVVPDDPTLRHDIDDADDLDAAEALLGHPLVPAPAPCA
jgi:2-phospho-L-lactate/phosphoenolpyruvate guanylyltransferase